MPKQKMIKSVISKNEKFWYKIFRLRKANDPSFSPVTGGERFYLSYFLIYQTEIRKIVRFAVEKKL